MAKPASNRIRVATANDKGKEYVADLKKIGAADPKAGGPPLGISARQSQRFAQGYPLSPVVRKLLRLAIETGRTKEDLEKL